MNYRSLPRISNSDLSEFRKVVLPQRGDDQPTPVAAYAFGSALHELILEPHVIHDLPADVDLSLVQRLARQVRNDKFCRWALQFSRKEKVILWEDAETGLPLKSKLDIVYKSRLVVDVKSTSQRDFAGFLRSCEQYDYDRQAAFYLDAIGGTKFVFVAIQKVKPYNVWIVEHHTNGAFIESGRKKYRRLLREWKQREQIGQPFTPSAWQSAPLNHE